MPQETTLRAVLAALASEVGEAISPTVVELKPWKTTGIDWEHVDEEIIDVLHFVFEYWLLRGFTEQQLFEAYVRKNEFNFTRIGEKLSQRD